MSSATSAKVAMNDTRPSAAEPALDRPHQVGGLLVIGALVLDEGREDVADRAQGVPG